MHARCTLDWLQSNNISCFCDIVSLFNYVIKPTSILITSPFSTSAKFREIPRKYYNSEEKGKFCGSADILRPAENCKP